MDLTSPLGSLVLELTIWRCPQFDPAYRVIVDVSPHLRAHVERRLSRDVETLVFNGALRFPVSRFSHELGESAVRSLSCQTIRNVFRKRGVSKHQLLYIHFHALGRPPPYPTVLDMAYLGWWEPMLNSPTDTIWYATYSCRASNGGRGHITSMSGDSAMELIMTGAPDDTLLAILQRTNTSAWTYWRPEWLAGKPKSLTYMHVLVGKI